MQRRQNNALLQSDRQEASEEIFLRHRVLRLMVKALELVTFLVNSIILFQDNIFMSTGYHLLTNILFKYGELNILGGTFQN